MHFADRCGLLALRAAHHGSEWIWPGSELSTDSSIYFAPAAGKVASVPQQRKKDLPDPSDKVGIARLVTSHSLQKTLVAQRSGSRQASKVASSSRPVSGLRRVWAAPAGSSQPLALEQRAAVLKSGGDFEALDRPTRHPKRRVLLDDFGSSNECRVAMSAADAALGVALEGASSTSHGESVVICSPPEQLRGSLGEGASRLVAMLCWRVLQAVRGEFDEDRPLFLAGAMLTSTRPPVALAVPSSSPSDTYDYGAAHVDRANVSSYDYSAVLYLNSKASDGGEVTADFEGGDFAFVDEAGDEVIEPRRGRLLLFPSGFEHLHRVRHVTRGTRVVLAQWWTLNPKAGHALHPAEYELNPS